MKTRTFNKGDRVVCTIPGFFYNADGTVYAKRTMSATGKTFYTVSFDERFWVQHAETVVPYAVSGLEAHQLCESITAECGCMTEPDGHGNEVVAMHSSSCEYYMEAN